MTNSRRNHALGLSPSCMISTTKDICDETRDFFRSNYIPSGKITELYEYHDKITECNSAGNNTPGAGARPARSVAGWPACTAGAGRGMTQVRSMKRLWVVLNYSSIPTQYSYYQLVDTRLRTPAPGGPVFVRVG